MLRSILVPLDGTAFGELAMPYARRLAELSGARLILLRAAPYHTLPAGGAHGRAPVGDARTYLEGWQQRLALDGIETEIDALHTDPAHAIRFSARLKGAELIVMSTHGRTGMGRAFMGSVADQVLHSTSTPLLLVRAGSTGWAGTGPRSVLLPLDGSLAAERVFGVIESLGLREDSVLHLVRVVAPEAAGARTLVTSPAGSEPMLESRKEQHHVHDEAHRYLETCAANLEGRRPVRLHLREGATVPELLRVADHEGCDLVVMTTHGQAGADRPGFGTVFMDVLHATEAPMLVVHA